jgi:hypothetical protein
VYPRHLSHSETVNTANIREKATLKTVGHRENGNETATLPKRLNAEFKTIGKTGQHSENGNETATLPKRLDAELKNDRKNGQTLRKW